MVYPRAGHDEHGTFRPDRKPLQHRGHGQALHPARQRVAPDCAVERGHNAFGFVPRPSPNPERSGRPGVRPIPASPGRTGRHDKRVTPERLKLSFSDISQPSAAAANVLLSQTTFRFLVVFIAFKFVEHGTISPTIRTSVLLSDGQGTNAIWGRVTGDAIAAAACHGPMSLALAPFCPCVIGARPARRRDAWPIGVQPRQLACCRASPATFTRAANPPDPCSRNAGLRAVWARDSPAASARHDPRTNTGERTLAPRWLSRCATRFIADPPIRDRAGPPAALCYNFRVRTIHP